MASVMNFIAMILGGPPESILCSHWRAKWLLPWQPTHACAAVSGPVRLELEARCSGPPLAWNAAERSNFAAARASVLAAERCDSHLAVLLLT